MRRLHWRVEAVQKVVAPSPSASFLAYARAVVTYGGEDPTSEMAVGLTRWFERGRRERACRAGGAARAAPTNATARPIPPLQVADRPDGGATGAWEAVGLPELSDGEFDEVIALQEIWRRRSWGKLKWGRSRQGGDCFTLVPGR